MKRVVFVAVLLLGFCALAMAEDVPKAEAFVGYSYYRCNQEGLTGDCNLNGGIASFTLNAFKWFSTVGEFNGTTGTVQGADVRTLTFMFGPQVFIRRNEKVTPFVHALVGDTYIHAKSGKDTIIKEHDLSFAFGGGLDLRVRKNISLRPFQVDYIFVRPKDAANMNNFRFGAGIVFKFGEQGN